MSSETLTSPVSRLRTCRSRAMCLTSHPAGSIFEVPEDCGLYIGGGADVKLENINTRAWKIIRA